MTLRHSLEKKLKKKKTTTNIEISQDLGGLFEVQGFMFVFVKADKNLHLWIKKKLIFQWHSAMPRGSAGFMVTCKFAVGVCNKSWNFKWPVLCVFITSKWSEIAFILLPNWLVIWSCSPQISLQWLAWSIYSFITYLVFDFIAEIVFHISHLVFPLIHFPLLIITISI